MDNNKIRPEIATEANIPQILSLIKDLAQYERLLDNVQATEDRLRHNLFGPRSFAEAVIAFKNDEPVAFAVYFFTFSTFLGSPGLYIEDFFVRPTFRRSGIGRQLFAFLSNRGRESGCSRIELSVLNWNEEAIRFYTDLGAESVQGWTVFRLSNDVIEKLASRCS